MTLACFVGFILGWIIRGIPMDWDKEENNGRKKNGKVCKML